MSKAKAAAALANRILPGIQCFAWNHDRSLVAVCPFSREILIFATNQKPDIQDWRLVEVLREVSSIIVSFFRGILSNSLVFSIFHLALLKCQLSRVAPRDQPAPLLLN